MSKKSTLLFILLVLGYCTTSIAQVGCPPNIDFEWGTTANWTFFTGTCCPGGSIVATTGTPPINGRHNLTTGASTDYYGSFPIVAPSGGAYSMRLGYDTNGRRAEQATYYVDIPSGSVNYALVYRYAIVLEDPGHTPSQQPRFTVNAYDSATGLPTPCAAYSYVATSGLPGFIHSPVTSRMGNGLDVIYRDWTTATINLTGLGGTTVRLDFAAGDCDLSGHFGYAYFDMSCGLFQVAGLTCDDTATTSTLSAPFGYAGYHWYDSATFTVLYGTTQTITIPIPPGPVTYAVILTPYSGFGCPDTLYTTLSPSHLALAPTPDTLICSGVGATITSGATDVALPLTYSWSPAAGLSCTGCANPVASPTTATTYTVTVTNVLGCQKTATIRVTVDKVTVDTATTRKSCHIYNDGTATAIPLTGNPPFIYAWSTIPIQTTATATALDSGTYYVTVTDALGCNATMPAIVKDGPITIITITGSTNPTKCKGDDGTITLSGLVPGTSFTITYLFNGVPQSQTHTASGAGVIVLTNLPRGTISNIGVVTAGCPYNVVGPVTLVDPLPPSNPVPGSNSPVCLGSIINLTATCATPGVSYTWKGPGGYTSVVQDPTINPSFYSDTGYYIVTATLDSCTSTDSTYVLVKPLPFPSASSSSPVCTGDTLFLTSSSSNGAGSYTWVGPDGFYSYNQNTSLGNVIMASAGTYTVTARLNGCTAIATTNVVVNQTPSAPTTTDAEYCQGDVAAQLTSTSANPLWYTDPAGGVGSTTAPTPSTAQVGTTTWYVSDISAAGCESPRTQVSVTVDYLATPALSLSDSVICRGMDVLMNALYTGDDMTSLTWYFSDGDSVKNQNPIRHSFDQTGTFTVSATAYYKVCPTKTVTKDITIYPVPEVYLGGDTTICPGGVALMLNDNVNANNPAASWVWSTGETHSYIKVTKPGTYYVKVYISGCAATDTLVVLNDCYMSLPNVFSPNGDGVNDYFFPRELLTKGLTSFKMDIYNRWGQLVYSTTGIDGRGWDGKFNDVPQPEGVFIYMIDATFKDGQIEHHTGNVTLLR